MLELIVEILQAIEIYLIPVSNKQILSILA
jgi:hypothetical protein